jgi:hypothetical protein
LTSDRIRNKGSPVKPPTAGSGEASGATTTTHIEKAVGKKGRRKLILNPDTASQTCPSASKPKKRKLDEIIPDSVQGVAEETPEPKKMKKLLSVKFDDRPLKKVGKARGGPRLANSPQRLSSIPVEVCIETLGSSPDVPGAVRPAAKTHPTVLTKKRLLIPDIMKKKAKKMRKGRPKKVPEEEVAEADVRPLAKGGRSTRSNEGRTTRSKDWSWEKVLLTNPDKISRKRF